MRKKPYSNKELFDIVVAKLKEDNRYPADILDYSLGALEEKEIRDYSFDASFRLNYGGSEGIYLDCYITLTENSKENIINLGTFKTLLTSPEAMRIMGTLAGDFVIVLTDFVNHNLDDFT